MKITVPIDWYTEPAPLVDGEIMDIAPHLAHVGTFIVHLAAPGDWSAKWKVTHLESGFCAGRGGATRKAVIDFARQALSEIDDKALLRMIKRAEKLKIKRHGARNDRRRSRR